MNRNWKRAAASLVIVVLVALLSLGCGAGNEEGKVTITIGELTDLTGPTSFAHIPIYQLWQDIVRYYNEGDLIPGVHLRFLAYDTRGDPARDLLGYEWLKDRGAHLICPVAHTSGQVVKPFAEKDEVAIANLATTVGLIEPPGWVFCFSNPSPWGMKALMKWISENHWDYAKGIPKVAFAGWSEPGGQEIAKAMEDYCQELPDEFEWVGSFQAPLGTMTFISELEKVKDCDYVASFVNPIAYFVKELHAGGYRATVIDIGTALCYTGFLADLCGWQALDGTLTGNVSLTWNEQTPIVDLAKELLRRYRPGQAEEIMRASVSYVGSCQQVVSILDVLRAAVGEVGAENFDGQAFYNSAVKYQTSGSIWEGYPEWSFSETKRYLVDDIVVYRFDAETESVVRVSDWLPATG